MILFLNDVGGSEVVVIFLVVLIFFGPKSIPGIAKTFGKTIYQIKQASDDIKKEVANSGLSIKKELNLDNLIDKATRTAEDEIMRPMEKEMNEVDKTLHSVSYTKPHDSVYKGEAELEEQKELGQSSETTREKTDLSGVESETNLVEVATTIKDEATKA